MKSSSTSANEPPLTHIVRVVTKTNPRNRINDAYDSEPLTNSHASRLFDQLKRYGKGMRVEVFSITFNKVIAQVNV